MPLFKKLIQYYTTLHPTLHIPKNDTQAFHNTKYNFIYNRFYIAQLQHLHTFPFPILPTKFPVVMKPFINLKGMGLNSIKINNIKEFNKYKYSSHFWVEFLKGKHLSIDLIINKGEILHYIVFEGIKGETFGSFSLWKEINYNIFNNKKLSKNINLILEKFNNYTGSLNLESIGGYIIEGHLRVGDIDMKQKDILELIIHNYLDNIFDNQKQINILLNKIKNTKYPKIYLVPIWSNIYPKYKLKKIYKFLENNIEQHVIDNKYVISYYFDDITHSSPFNKKRWFVLVCQNLKKILLLKNFIQNEINNFIQLNIDNIKN